MVLLMGQLVVLVMVLMVVLMVVLSQNGPET